MSMDAPAMPARPFRDTPVSTAINALPDRRSPVMTHQDNRSPTPSAPAIPAVAAAPDDNLPHADYNLGPLEVHGLDHYVKYEDDERFHVC